MKRSDLPERDVLAYVRRVSSPREKRYHGMTDLPLPDAHFVALGFPQKVVEARLDQLVDKGYLDYGVSLRTCWITPEGLARLKELEDE